MCTMQLLYVIRWFNTTIWREVSSAYADIACRNALSVIDERLHKDDVSCRLFHFENILQSEKHDLYETKSNARVITYNIRVFPGRSRILVS